MPCVVAKHPPRKPSSCAGFYGYRPVKPEAARIIHAYPNQPLDNGRLYTHYSEVPPSEWHWPNFSPAELASDMRGEFYYHPPSFDAIQRARDIRGRALVINSAHRSWLHNIAIGGAARSAHLYIAFDVSTRGHDPFELYLILRSAGFKSFGFYTSFIHVDLRAGRMWYGNQAAREMWQPFIDGMVTL